jgi:branched-chain amino acid transport system permease protein
VQFEQIAQLAVAGAINGSFYALLGVGFGLILGVVGRFHYAYALTFVLAAYIMSVLESSLSVWPPLAAGAGLLAAMALGVALERWVYSPLASSSGALALLTVFISALGITIAGVNLITLMWTAFSRSIYLFEVRPFAVAGVTFTTLDLFIVFASWLLIGLLTVALNFTDLGRSIKAVRGNPFLARIIGLKPDRLYLVVFAIGSFLSGVAGILNGARFAVVPNMGDRPVVFAFVVAFLGGTRSSPLTVGLAGLFIGLIESLSGLWVSPQWSALVVFSVLFIYLSLQPTEISGLRRWLSLGARSRG